MNNIIDVAMGYLSSKSCTEQELKLQLEQKFLGLADYEIHINSAISYLKDLHIINDGRLAEHIAMRFTHKGNRFIREALLQKGISNAVIDRTLALLDAEYPRALEEARKNSKRLQRNSLEKSRTSLARFLNGRRFSYKTINAVVSKLITEELRFFNNCNQKYTLHH